MKIYRALKKHRCLWQVFALLIITGFNAHHALAVIPHVISIGCPGTEVPTAPQDLMRIKGDSEPWSFDMKPEPGVVITDQVWTYRSKDGNEPNWGSFTGGDNFSTLTWSSPNIADHFTINVKAKRHCAGGGEGEDNFEITWGGNVVGVIIKRDGNDITEPQDNPQEVKVGQIMKLTAEVQNAPTNADITYQWTVPGIIVKDWVHNATSSEVKKVLPDDMKKPGLDYAWVDGGNGRQVKLSVKINGKDIPSVKSTFNVSRPNYQIEVTPIGPVEFTLWPEPNAFPHYIGYLHDANKDIDPNLGSNENHGVKISMVGVPFNDQTDYNFVQLVTSTVRRKHTSADGEPSPKGWIHTIMPGDSQTLDTIYPYPMSGRSYAYDSPGESAHWYQDELIVADTFTDYLMYKPPGAEHTNSIYVPLSKVSWSWGGHVARTNPLPPPEWWKTDVKGTPQKPSYALGTSTTSYPGGDHGWNKNILQQDMEPEAP